MKCQKPCAGSLVIVGGGQKEIDGGQNAVYGVNAVDHI